MTATAPRIGGARPTGRRCSTSLKGYNVVGIFHGHQHETPLLYHRDGLDLVKPKAAYMGGFALARITGQAMDVVLGEAIGDHGEVAFTNAFSKTIEVRQAVR